MASKSFWEHRFTPTEVHIELGSKETAAFYEYVTKRIQVHYLNATVQSLVNLKQLIPPNIVLKCAIYRYEYTIMRYSDCFLDTDWRRRSK